ncbi:hypothetical protein CYMTET_41599 [Cymbomonas tetramitiformis]|uniref:Uncharacterized protein n=1 Tax=Cymbomonas tetramitiformis TaxID=36881 RepID=A0AAE0F1U9_9CHLO|nr:hypothetical protein CYMTET_41599 [Cymbomonas tetramitiformis]
MGEHPDDTNFGELCDDVELIEAVKGKQMEALSSNIQRLREQICIFNRLSSCLERLALEGRQFFQDLKPEQTTLGGIRRGGNPSICECQEGLEDFSRIHRDECNLKSALVKGLTLHTSAAELDQILALMHSQPNIDPGYVKHLRLMFQPLE